MTVDGQNAVGVFGDDAARYPRPAAAAGADIAVLDFLLMGMYRIFTKPLKTVLELKRIAGQQAAGG